MKRIMVFALIASSLVAQTPQTSSHPKLHRAAHKIVSVLKGGAEALGIMGMLVVIVLAQGSQK